ncbi:MAG TPA: VTT domain-containing protein [Candidatus Binatia bacterium]|nr:VTT domain-containing protein [Candidatus Binatia bacterium]
MTKKRVLILVLLMLATISLTALWRWTPMADWFNLQRLTNWASEFRQSPTAPLWILAAFVIAGQVFFPITLLGLATIFAFGPLFGSIYSVVGALLAGLVTYAGGRLLGEAAVANLAGPKFEKVRQQIKSHGLATSIMVHILPVAPFTLVNLLSGACGLSVRDFTMGTLIGQLPGVASIVIFQNQLERAIRSPDAANLTLLVLVITGLTMATFWLQRRIRRQSA